MTISEEKRLAIAQSLRELANKKGLALIDYVNNLRVDEVKDYILFGVGVVLAMDKVDCCDAEDASGYLSALADVMEEEGLQWRCMPLEIGSSTTPATRTQR